MNKRFAIILFSILISTISCTVQSKLAKNYKGKNEVFLVTDMGKPNRIDKLTGGRKTAVYEKRTLLGRAPINTGQFQYDRFDSPKATKIETFLFYINASGFVEDVKYECVYER